MKVAARDALTVPNAMTAARGASIPYVYRGLRDNPGEFWWKAGLIAFSDKLDGLLAKQEDRSVALEKLGFRRSELGRKLDPIVDKVFTFSSIVAGMRGGSVPKSLGTVSIIQKVAASCVSMDAERRQEEVHVSSTGKLGEFATVVAFGSMMGATGIERQAPRQLVRASTQALAVAGIALSAVATVGYARQSGRLPTEPTPFEARTEELAHTIVTLPDRIFHPQRVA